MNALNPMVFEHAADYLLEHGHTRGDYTRGARRCAVGAIYEGVIYNKALDRGWCEDEWSGTHPTAELTRLAEPYVELATLAVNDQLDVWNDRPGRRRGHVVSLFRKLAENVRKENAL